MIPFDDDTPEGGLAAERTDLAWNRSGLALLACGVAVARGLSHPSLERANVAIGVVILLLGGFTWTLGGWQARRRSRPGHLRERATSTDLLPVALGTAGVGVAAFVLATFFPG